MILLIDTTKERIGKNIYNELLNNQMECQYIDTINLKISYCLGCNYCWLKNPGKCVIQDDYEPILKQIIQANQVWLISDTKFGFISYQTKNIVDRLMPIVTMNLHMVGKQMRHITRYNHNPDWGVIYIGEGDQEYLNQWCNRVAINFNTHSKGVYSYEKYKEAILCM